MLGGISPGKRSWTGPSSGGLTLQAIPLCPFVPSLAVSLQGELHSGPCATRMCGGACSRPRGWSHLLPSLSGLLRLALGSSRSQRNITPWEEVGIKVSSAGPPPCLAPGMGLLTVPTLVGGAIVTWHLAPGAGLLVLHVLGYWCWAPGVTSARCSGLLVLDAQGYWYWTPGVNDAGRPGLVMLDALGY